MTLRDPVRDDHDRRLLENVHPPGWRNPVPRDRYHLVVIGGGTGGLVTAAIASTLGARVALVERHLLGGDCLNVGCVPSKALIAAGRAWKAARDVESRLAGPAAAGQDHFVGAIERMRRIRAELSDHDSARRFQDLGVDVFFGEASFLDSGAIQVAGETLRFRKAVIATGTRPAAPPVPGLEAAGYLTNETVFSLSALPSRVAVIGGGSTGCELAQALVYFGARVTLIESGERILAGDDPDAAAVVAAGLRRDGIDLRCGARIGSVERTDAGRVVRFQGAAGEIQEIEVDDILVATGRTPNTDGLGLARAGIATGPGEEVVVDRRLRTTNRRVYAIGDAASNLRFTHVADAHARLAVRNALFGGRGSVRDLVIPWCTYTAPELAHVGPPPAELGSATLAADILTVEFDQLDRARLEGETDGFLRIHLRSGSDEIVAATIVGEQAGELIGHLSQAITTGTGLSKLGETILPYPTRGEIVRRAADQWRRRRLTTRTRRLLRAWFRLMN